MKRGQATGASIFGRDSNHILYLVEFLTDSDSAGLLVMATA